MYGTTLYVVTCAEPKFKVMSISVFSYPPATPNTQLSHGLKSAPKVVLQESASNAVAAKSSSKSDLVMLAHTPGGCAKPSPADRPRNMKPPAMGMAPFCVALADVAPVGDASEGVCINSVAPDGVCTQRVGPIARAMVLTRPSIVTRCMLRMKAALRAELDVSGAPTRTAERTRLSVSN